ncbi:hypothetical protein EV649_5812 [Kribbella sp. VKM Ac-2569]|nr:hypothetical protein EV649_5812 [Kribbella sp. VKM Ac-2569]
MGAGVALAGSLVTGAAADDPKVTPRNEWSVPLDVTGDWDLSAERDRLAGLLKPLAAYDGGMLWNASTKTLTVQMTSSAALLQAKSLIARSATRMRVNFVRVQYSAKDLDELAARLLQHQRRWAGASGIGGGFDPTINRVLLQVDPDYEYAATLIRAINRLHDPRVVLQTIRSTGEGSPDSPALEPGPDE